MVIKVAKDGTVKYCFNRKKRSNGWKKDRSCMDVEETVMLHKVRFVSEGTRTRLFLDDQEVLGCVKASFDYEVNALPIVRLELNALNVEVEAETADVCKLLEETKKGEIGNDIDCRRTD